MNPKPTTQEIFVSINNLSIKAGDGFCYPLTKRFLYLYFYLALKRIEDKEGGFIETDEVLSLPYWERNTAISIGKQIRRHIVNMEKLGRSLIEARQKIQGPFRLKISPKQIQLDISIVDLREILGLNHAVKLDEKKENNLYSFVDLLWTGGASFNDGILKEALRSYNKSLKVAISPEQRILSLQKAGRTLMRLGDFRKAQHIFKSIFREKKLNDLESATAYTGLGLIKFNFRKIDEAEKLYQKALDCIQGKKYYRVLGDIYNGFGLIMKERGQYKEALSFHQRAMEYWILDDYFYGIQASYFNIGNIFMLWGDKHHDFKKYQTAINWLKDCINLCGKMGIGFETSQDHILIASIYRKLGDFDKALEYATEANKIARNANNRKDLTISYKVLENIYNARGEQELAKKCFRLFTQLKTKFPKDL